MGRVCWLALILCVPGTLSGCFTGEASQRASWLKKFQQQATPPDHAILEIALLERPIGDALINDRIWKETDEFIVDDPERRRAIEENGLRLGQLVGAPPREFQQMLLSKRCCVNSQARIFPAGKAVPIWLGAGVPHTFFDFVIGNRRQEVSFDQARFGLEVTATFTKDGRTRLTFTPQVENGEQLLPFQADPENSTWKLRIEKASKKYPELGWEATLGANQYLVVGARLERDRTLGPTAFVQLDGVSGVQRLLVIRNCRSVTGHEAQENTVAALIAADRTPPLALQATIPVSRAKAQ
ncbi:MAG: hypothetical protein HYX68_03990 [Planctomycetes bacterium]|nr:hypothetical protein [Planctomycetota bacterium]